MDALLAQAFVDRGARAVGRLRMSTSDATVRPRVQTLVEEALRLTTLPGEDQGRVYVFQRLRLPALDIRAAPSQWMTRCATHLLEMCQSAIHASDPRAARADAVYFTTRHEPARLLMLQLLQGGAAAEWFWPQATAIPCGIAVGDRIEGVLDRWRIQEAGWAGVAREQIGRAHV